MGELWPFIVWPGTAFFWLVGSNILERRRERRTVRRAYFYKARGR